MSEELDYSQKRTAQASVMLHTEACAAIEMAASHFDAADWQRIASD